MKRALTVLVAMGMCASIFSAPAPPPLNDPVEGAKLANKLRAFVPPEGGEVKGTLRISTVGGEPREVPIVSSITLEKDRWASTYVARFGAGTEEKLVIEHFTNRPGRYELHQAGQTRSLSGSEATNSFAGSDFALCDLGLEFIQWPRQVLFTKEMRKGRGCYVLESRPATNHVYSRVLAWLDQETIDSNAGPGILFAEAYDARGKLLKEFEVSAFNRAQRQVSRMEIRNRQTKGSTRLQIDFDE